MLSFSFGVALAVPVIEMHGVGCKAREDGIAFALSFPEEVLCSSAELLCLGEGSSHLPLHSMRLRGALRRAESEIVRFLARVIMSCGLLWICLRSTCDLATPSFLPCIHFRLSIAMLGAILSLRISSSNVMPSFFQAPHCAWLLPRDSHASDYAPSSG